jgi:hypothetical protein
VHPALDHAGVRGAGPERRRRGVVPCHEVLGAAAARAQRVRGVQAAHRPGLEPQVLGHGAHARGRGSDVEDGLRAQVLERAPHVRERRHRHQALRAEHVLERRKDGRRPALDGAEPAERGVHEHAVAATEPEAPEGLGELGAADLHGAHARTHAVAHAPDRLAQPEQPRLDGVRQVRRERLLHGRHERERTRAGGPDVCTPG